MYEKKGDFFDPKKQGLEKAQENAQKVDLLAHDMSIFRIQKERLDSSPPTEFDAVLQAAFVDNLLPDYLEHALRTIPILQAATLQFLDGQPSPIKDPDEFPLGLVNCLFEVVKTELPKLPHPEMYDTAGDGLHVINLRELLTHCEDGTLNASDLWNAVEDPQWYRKALTKILIAQLRKAFDTD